jgi:hypothetical protein
MATVSAIVTHRQPPSLAPCLLYTCYETMTVLIDLERSNDYNVLPSKQGVSAATSARAGTSTGTMFIFFALCVVTTLLPGFYQRLALGLLMIIPLQTDLNEAGWSNAPLLADVCVIALLLAGPLVDERPRLR